MEIIKLKAACMDYLWGGHILQERYGKGKGMPRVAESWELSAHPAGESTVCSGKDSGMKFTGYLHKYGKEILGERGEKFKFFPVLIKWIDAEKPLSVQVHPSDEYGLRVEGEYGKTEMWYVMDAKPGASLYFGVNRELSREELKQRIADNSLTEVLNQVEVHPGDVFFIESGTIHAIGEGILICEIQQNSNTTYRVYDYGRRDDKGNLRELHIDKALEVSSLIPVKPEMPHKEVKIPGGTFKELAQCKYFTCGCYDIDGETTIMAGNESFTALSILSGEGSVAGSENTLNFNAGDSIFIPANTGEVKISGKFKLISTCV